MRQASNTRQVSLANQRGDNGARIYPAYARVKWIFGISFLRHAVTAESRLRKKAAIASDYAQSKSAVMKQNPQALKSMLADDHDTAVHLSFRPYMNHSLGTLKKLDQAKDMISSSGEAPDKKQAAIDALDKARELEVAKADRVDQAVDMVLKRVHQRRGTGLVNLPFLRSVRQNQPAAP